MNRTAIAKAGHTGDTDVIAAALTHVDPAIRRSALIAAARAGVCQPSDLDSALGDPDPGVRRTGAELARVVRPGRSLVTLLDDPDSRVAETVAFVLGELNPPEPGSTTQLSRVATEHADALVREAAVAALGAIGEPDGLAAILVGCGDIAPIRRRAAIALAAYDDETAGEQLVRMLTDRDRHVRQIAEDLIGPDGEWTSQQVSRL